MPEPPQQFRFPELLPNTGSVLLSADQITVKERVTCEVSFALSRGDRLVVTGPNGAGKSTLLSVLAGELHPSTGFVRRPPGIRLGFLRLEVRRARAELAEQFETELGKHPDGPILMSLPGVGCRTAVTMLVEISGIDRFPNAGHLAVYAGVAPRTHRSGTSIKEANTTGTAVTPDSNAPCIFRRLQHCVIHCPVRTTTASVPKVRTTDLP